MSVQYRVTDLNDGTTIWTKERELFSLIPLIAGELIVDRKDNLSVDRDSDGNLQFICVSEGYVGEFFARCVNGMYAIFSSQAGRGDAGEHLAEVVMFWIREYHACGAVESTCDGETWS